MSLRHLFQIFVNKCEINSCVSYSVPVFLRGMTSNSNDVCNTGINPTNWFSLGIALATFFFLVIKYWKNIIFQWKFLAFLALGYLSVFLALPTTLRNPGDARNIVRVSQLIAFLCRWIGVTYELRGLENVTRDEGAMLATNHQQMIDILGIMNHMSAVGRLTLIMKKAMMYHPGGLASWMYGVVFIDRHSGQQSHHNVNSWAHMARDQKNKVWIHPEGTRYFEAFKSQCLLPFKKGTFHAAIAAQVPIIPLVFSPYCFINHDRGYFGRGTVIMDVLEPIPTRGMTAEDAPALLEKVRAIMTSKYRQLTDELLSTLPPSHPFFKWLEDVDILLQSRRFVHMPIQLPIREVISNKPKDVHKPLERVPCPWNQPNQANDNNKRKPTDGDQCPCPSYNGWKMLTYLICLPVIAILSFSFLAFEQEEEERPEFVPYEYLYIRKKKFPWGDGDKSLFHNPHKNPLPDGYEDIE